jgi:hypothetical protein
MAPVRYPRQAGRGAPRIGCGVPATVTGLTTCAGRAVAAAGAPVAACCFSRCPKGWPASGAPGSGGRPPRPPGLSELAGRPPRAAQVSRNRLPASRKVPGRTTRLLLTSVFGAVMVPETFSRDEAWITLPGARISCPAWMVMLPPLPCWALAMILPLLGSWPVLVIRPRV